MVEVYSKVQQQHEVVRTFDPVGRFLNVTSIAGRAVENLHILELGIALSCCLLKI